MSANASQPAKPPVQPPYKIDDRGGDELHAPDLYNHDAIAEPVAGLDAIGDAEIAFYHEHGYLAVNNAFTEQEIADALAGMVDLIMGRNPDFTGLMFERRAADRIDQLTAEERQDALRKLMHFVDHEPRLKALSEHPKLLRVVRKLIGDREPTMFQDMGLIKPPQIGREKPWHQDCAYFNVSLDTPVVGAWIAFDRATVENGCMRVLEGAHREGPIIHWQRRDWQICDTDMYEKYGKPYRVVAAPLEPGGVLLFNGMLPHGTPHNNSGQRRRAVQYHYYPSDVQKVSQDDRLAVFGSEGKDVEC